MDMQRGVVLLWLVLLLGGIDSLQGYGYGQETLSKAEEGTAAAEEVQRLHATIDKLYKEGKYAEALPIAQQVLAIAEQALGPTHPALAAILNNLASLYHHQGQYAEAVPLYQRALRIQEQALGPTHPDLATILDNLARLYSDQGQYAEAIPLYQRALRIQEQVLGSEHPALAAILNNLAKLYSDQGQYAEAVPLYQRAVRIQEQALGPSHPDLATSLHNLASLYCDQGQYAEAVPLHQRALRIREQALGPSHPAVATSLSNLAVLYSMQGQYAEAVPLHQRALRIREQALGLSHPAVATSLNNLASLYYHQGQYAEAVPLYQRAVRIVEQALGPSHPAIATSLHNLAELYHIQGQYAEAVPLYQRAVRIREQALGPSHPDVANSLHNLASLYRDLGQYAEAEGLYQHALSILEQTVGSTHPHLANSLHNLASLYRAQGQYAEAEVLHQRALHIREQALGPSHPDVANSLHSLAGLYFDQGQYAKAVPLYQQALSIVEQALGPMHPHLATSLYSLATVYLFQGNHTQAVQLQMRSSDIREHNLTVMLTLGTEAQKLASAVTLHSETDTIISLHAGFAPHDPQALRLALTTVLRRKGRVLDAMTDSLATLRQRVQPEDQQLLAQWVAARGQLSTLISRGLGTQSPEDYWAQWARLETEAQQLEAQLSARSAPFRAQTQPVTLEQVQAAIPEGAALVELAVYAPFTPPRHWGAERYVAYVLHRQGDPAWVDLGEAAPIDQAVKQFRADLSGYYRLQVKHTARALDELVMRPIRPLLGAARHILLAPDGTLNLVPFGALVDETQHYVLQRFTISYLTTGRDLLRPPSQRTVSQPPLVVGNPDFDLPRPSFLGRAAAALSVLTSLWSANGQVSRFPPLPGTAQEVQAVHRLLPGSQLWTGAAASEAALKQVQRPRLLHLATHGFFRTDQPPPPRPTRVPQMVSAELPASPLEPPIENPLLRAGLALAGANAPQPGMEDGLLTALEVAGLDLWGTELVVLSACDTGLGQVHNGEGVYGLRRALVMAGAASQLMSLWRVADEDSTPVLMGAYYRRLLAGEGRAEALRQVQLTMLASPQHVHPYYWAAFMLSGAWTPLNHR